ncbi:hypothetical protein M405DRAFT_855853 [Rhizopogon salebrosus TDB-379]|nr:hypothetical protein M405DRAFT_855853 [Rhizopogon salebrosus TDB-379]
MSSSLLLRGAVRFPEPTTTSLSPSLSNGFPTVIEIANYLSLLGVQSIMVQRPRTAGEPVVRAPVALDVLILHQEDPSTHRTNIVRSMVENGWSALFAALSFVISTNLSDEMFVAFNERRRDARPQHALQRLFQLALEIRNPFGNSV